MRFKQTKPRVAYFLGCPLSGDCGTSTFVLPVKGGAWLLKRDVSAWQPLTEGILKYDDTNQSHERQGMGSESTTNRGMATHEHHGDATMNRGRGRHETRGDVTTNRSTARQQN